MAFYALPRNSGHIKTLSWLGAAGCFDLSVKFTCLSLYEKTIHGAREDSIKSLTMYNTIHGPNILTPSAAQSSHTDAISSRFLYNAGRQSVVTSS